MSKITALAISVSILGGIATWLFLSSGTLLIWAAFVAWACFFFSGGDEAALKSTIVSNIFGVLVAATAALVIASVPLGDVIGSNIEFDRYLACVCERVESDEVGGAKRRALRTADYRPGQTVDFLDRVAVFEHRPQRRRDRKGTDAVRNKVWGILGKNDALAEHVAPER